MKNKANYFLKHLLMLSILIVYAFLAAGSSSTKKGIKSYLKGDYDMALKELKGTTTDGSGDFIDEFWFLGQTYKALGDSSNAEKCKTKAFQLYLKSESDAKAFAKKYPEEDKKLTDFGKNYFNGTWKIVRGTGLEELLDLGLMIKLVINTKSNTFQIWTYVNNKGQLQNTGNLTFYTGKGFEFTLPDLEPTHNDATIYGKMTLKNNELHYSTDSDVDWVFEK